ncbi:hypothetical protein N0824_00212 [Microcystis sp. 0824]|nr:hypothetical protein N0824_00212 [Microcystis sp. 0824]
MQFTPTVTSFFSYKKITRATPGQTQVLERQKIPFNTSI